MKRLLSLTSAPSMRFFKHESFNVRINALESESCTKCNMFGSKKAKMRPCFASGQSLTGKPQTVKIQAYPQLMDEPDSIRKFCSATLGRYFRLSNGIFRPQISGKTPQKLNKNSYMIEKQCYFKFYCACSIPYLRKLR